MPNSRILIVDDEVDVILGLKLRLESEGHFAFTARDGIEALELLGRTKVDMVLADLMMPKLDGLELTRRLRQDSRWLDTQVLLLSCNDDPDVRNLALEFGAQDYLLKTLGGPAIVSRINEVLASSRNGHTIGTLRSGQGQAERDLTVQLRAISENSGEIDGSVRLVDAGAARPEEGLGAIEAVRDLYHLAAILWRHSITGDLQDFKR